MPAGGREGQQKLETCETENLNFWDYKNVMMESVAEGLDKYQDMAKQVLNSKRVQDGLAEMLLELVYKEFAKKRGAEKPAH